MQHHDDVPKGPTEELVAKRAAGNESGGRAPIPIAQPGIDKTAFGYDSETNVTTR